MVKKNAFGANSEVLSEGSAAVALPAMATASEAQTPILKLFRELRAHLEWADGPATDAMSDEEFNKVCAERREIEERLFAMPCQNSMDVLAKLVAFTSNGIDFADDEGDRGLGILAEAKSAIDQELRNV